jgi:hypothetical protein
VGPSIVVLGVGIGVEVGGLVVGPGGTFSGLGGGITVLRCRSR